MRIKRLETYSQRHLSFVKVITDEGSQGVGQISPYDADISALVFHRLVAPVALGWDPMNLDHLVDRVVVETFKYPGSFVCRALAGLDTAIWDLRGKLEGKSVCELLGGITRAMRAAKMAEKAGMPFVPHSANLSLVTVFTMHLLAATQNRGLHFEFCIEKEPWFEDLYTPALQVRDGQVQIPEGPGWGVEIKPRWLADAELQVSEL